MKMNSQAVLHGMKTSKGEYEGRAFDSTQFQLAVDLGESSVGESMGTVTRPFKFGDSSEFEKWRHLKNSWPAGGVLCDCEFDVIAAADNTTKLTLLGIKPVQRKAAAV